MENVEKQDMEKQSFFQQKEKRSFQTLSHFLMWGLILTLFRINIWYIGEITTVLGYCCLFYVVNCLKKENRWFLKLQIVFSILFAIMLLQVFFHATPIYLNYAFEVSILSGMSGFLWILFYYDLTKGLLMMATEEVVLKQLKKATRYILCFIVLLESSIVVLTLYGIREIPLINLISLGGVIIFLIFGIGAFYGFYQAIKPLQQKEIIISEESLFRIKLWNCGYCLLCLFCIVIGSGLSNNWNENPPKQREEIQVTDHAKMIKEQLMNHGVSQPLIDDLTKEDLERIKDVKNVQMDTVFCSLQNRVDLSENMEQREEKEIKGPYFELETLYIENSKKEVYSIHYWKWKKKPLHWNDGISVEITCFDEESANLTSIKPTFQSGWLLYKKGEKEYQRQLPRLADALSSSMENTDWFFSMSAYRYEGVLGGMTYPVYSSKQRGYIMFEYTDLPKKLTCITNSVQYIHHTNFIQYPYQYPEMNLYGEGERYYGSQYFLIP